MNPHFILPAQISSCNDGSFCFICGESFILKCFAPRAHLNRRRESWTALPYCVCVLVYVLLTERLQCVSNQSTRTTRAERRKRFLWSSGYPRSGWRKGKNGCNFISSLINILSLHMRFSSSECCLLACLMQ